MASDGTWKGDTAPASTRPRASDAASGPALFLISQGKQPLASPARVLLGRLDHVEVARGAALDIAPVRARRQTIGLAVPDAKVSAKHAVLMCCLGRWCVEDRRSRNGTFVNGRRVEGAELADGDVIELGDTLFRFRTDVAQDGPLVHQPSRTARRGLTSMLPSLQHRLDDLARMAPTPVTILIEGESGSGKEIVARSVHALSGRPGQLVAVNCGGLPQERVEAELFGWRRGAFPGAAADHPGLVKTADGGTLFLDEIGDLRLPNQAALLRVLQEREVLPVAGVRPIRVDLRTIAATHQPLDELADTGGFRVDLLARLSGYRIRLAPLRERREDLGLVMADILANQLDAGVERLTIRALRALVRHAWPANIRELEQALTQAAVRARDGVIDVDDLPPTVLEPDPAAGGSAREADAGAARAAAPVDDLRAQLVGLMQEHAGNVAAVARDMGKKRMQIHRWLKRYGLTAQEFRR